MRVPIVGKSNVGTAGADWLLVIYFIACFYTDNLKKKLKNQFAMQNKKDRLKYTSYYFFINSAKKYFWWNNYKKKSFHPFSPSLCSVERSGGIFYSLLNC